MFRYSINNLNKLNKKQILNSFSTIKNLNKNERIILINPINSTKPPNSKVSSIFNNISNLNGIRSYSTINEKLFNNKQEKQQKQEKNKQETNNKNENENENQNENSSDNEAFEFLNRNKKRVLYSMGIVAMGAYSMFGGTPNNDDEATSKYHEFLGFRVKEKDLVIGTIIALNTIVFALLKNPAFLSHFGHHFYCSPQSLTRYPASIILSTFTHTEILHFGFNMYALFNFGGTVYESMGFRDFIALYLLGGLVGSMTSLTYKLITAGFEIPSIGASGSILAMVAASVHLEKESRLSIMFLPISFEPIQFIYGLMLFDLVGVLFRRVGSFTNWDHACHLGSSVLGFSVGSLYQYKSRFNNFTGQGKSISEGHSYNGSFKNGEYNGYGELKDTKYIRRGVFNNGQFMAGEVVQRNTGRKGVYQRNTPNKPQ